MPLCIEGVAFTPQNEDSGLPIYHESEIDENVAEAIKGKPVFIEHDTEVAVGKVVDATVTEDKSIWVNMEMDLPSVDTRIEQKIRQGVLTGLSLGWKTNLYEDPTSQKIKVHSREPEEVSLVMKGDRPNTFITNIYRK